MMPRRASAAPSDTLYLQRIGMRWYARIPVPNGLRAQLGPYIRKALDTSDLKEAQKRRWPVREKAERQFEALRRKGRPAGLSPEELSYANFLKKLATEVGPAVVVTSEGEEMHNPALEQLVDELEESGAFEKHPELGEALADHVEGGKPVSEVLEDYLTHNKKRSPTTVANYRTTVKQWIKDRKDRPLKGVKRAEVLEWLERFSASKARDTLKRYATVMSHLWNWAHRKAEDPPANPFEGVLKNLGSKGRAVQSYGFYTDEELKKAFKAVEPDDQLRPVFLMSLYTGFRLDECLRAEREVLSGVECFVLKGGKTDNASRVVPVHPRLKDVVVSRKMKASALSVRYGRLMKEIKMPEGKTFHSLRKAFTTALERAHCPEAIAARLVGHAPLGLTYGLYSQGHEAAELRSWVERVTLPI